MCVVGWCCGVWAVGCGSWEHEHENYNYTVNYTIYIIDRNIILVLVPGWTRDRDDPSEKL